MNKNKKFLIFALILIFVAGCQSVSTEEMPLDEGKIKTEAVKTAIAEITVQAILNPTPVVLVQTVPPSIQETPTETIATEEPTPVPTPTPPPPVYACTIDQSLSLPEDGPQPAGSTIEKTWVIKNTGNVAWTSENVEMKWVAGVNLSDSNTIDWQGTIDPGDIHEFILGMQIPGEPIAKAQIIEWGLVNLDKEIFCKLYYLIPSTY